MPPIGFLGSPLFLACCGSILSRWENDTASSNVTALSDASAAYPPLQNPENTTVNAEVQIAKGAETTDPDRVINININFAPFAEKSSGQDDNHNVIQINIFNYGAPGTLHTILETKGGEQALSFGTKEQPESSISKIVSSELPWWKTSVIYQIYPRSFMDASGTGTGDLKGITSKVDYLKQLGIGAVWLSPIYVSPMADFGYDVANFTDIDPIFGTLKDFDELLSALHKAGIRVILDFIPNHSSIQHPWFQKSVKRIDPYTDYYVWQPSKGFNESGQPIPPNNWLGRFGFSAWEWNDEREEFYLHQFLKEQPDLNVRNPAVMAELDNVIKFWFDRKVDGLRIDSLKFLFETEDLSKDEPVDLDSEIQDANEYIYLKHSYSVNQPETVDAVRRWRQISDQYEDRLMMAEICDDDVEQVMKYYGNETDAVSHFPLNFYLATELQNRSSVTGENLRKTLAIWFDNMPKGKWPNWMLGNHDQGRVSTRLGSDMVDAMNAVSLLLPGTPTTYYGEEIGMEDTLVTFEEAQDPFGINFGSDRYDEFGRDPARTPMQWNGSPNAGFSNANSTWLPINDNYTSLNVEAQQSSPQSHLKVYQSLTKLRQEKTFTHGEFDYAAASEGLFGFVRYLTGEPTYLVVINTSTEEKIFDLTQESTYEPPKEGIVKIRSSFDDRTQTSIGSKISLSGVSLLGGEVLVISLDEMHLRSDKNHDAFEVRQEP